MKKWKITGCLVLLAMLLGMTGEAQASGTNLSNITSDSIKDMENQIDNADDYQAELKQL